MLLYHRGFYSEFFKHRGYGNISAAVHGRIDYFNFFTYFLYGFFGKRKAQKTLIISLFETFTDDGIRAPVLIGRYILYFVLLNREIVGYGGYVFYDFGGIFHAHLRAVRAVNFITVVFLGIVACGYHYARVAIELPHRVGKHRYGTRLRIDINLYSVIQKNACGGTGEQIGLVARIVGNGNAPLHGRRTFGFYKFGKTLRGSPYGINIHFIRSVTYYSAHTRRTEFEFRAESVFYRLIVALDGFEFFKTLVAKIGAGEPVIVTYFIIHIRFSSDNCII